MKNTEQENLQNINVIELRNYLLKPNKTPEFSLYFDTNFVVPMNKLGGYTFGQFKIKEVNDRFVWLRGFTDMKSRLQFLTDFYIDSPVWKKYGKGANEMMINSDNVYLLKPLNEIRSIDYLKSSKLITVIDFYVCNSTLDKVINLFETSYLPFLKRINIEDVTLWVSEMNANDFPHLPVFQDKNLLVSITHYTDEKDFEAKQKEINEMPAPLKLSMQQLITFQNTIVLVNQNV